ncbi:MAG TPA: pseudaminic acid cytidylyltransferase [Verrucomicrobiae bacterium]|nr:pseudaminic acid cytidylyltransferase [Verrucomicrobiae bacterium]
MSDIVMSTIAIIPARGGSKRIPRKNVKPFCGQPMLAWPIAAARASGVFDAILISTDDDEVAAVAERHGAEAPFRRPAELADDRTPTQPVIAHALRWFTEHRGPVEFVCCIYATAPFLQARYLREGLELLRTHPDADFTFAVTSYAYPIFRSLKRNPDRTVAMFWPEHEMTRSQDLPEAWHDAGQFYWGRGGSFLKHPGVFSARSYPVTLPRHLVQDIDTPEDWQMAERLFDAARQANPGEHA